MAWLIVAGHCGISPLCSRVECLLWNYQDVLPLLENSAAVKLVLSGHGHEYKHAVSERGKHYVTMRAALETAPNEKSWAIVRTQSGFLSVKAYDGAETDEFSIAL